MIRLVGDTEPPTKASEQARDREEVLMKGFIAAAGLSSRLQDLSEKRNKVLLDLGGETILGNILNQFEASAIEETFVAVGHDAVRVRQFCDKRATCVLNPFYEQFGILSSFWLARPYLDGEAFLFSVGDHYSSFSRFNHFFQDQPEAEILVDVELKVCDDEDMKVFLRKSGQLRTITKATLPGPVLGEMTGVVRFSSEGSRQFFEVLEQHVWQHGIHGYLADVLCTVHRKWELAFHLSTDHHRVEVDYPYDLEQARQLYQQAQAA